MLFVAGEKAARSVMAVQRIVDVQQLVGAALEQLVVDVA